MKATLETELQRAIQGALGKIPGVICYRNSVFSGRLPSGHWAKTGLGSGSADLICCVKGRFVALEVKVAGEEAKPHQAEWGAKLMERGGVYAVVTSVRQALDVVLPMITVNS